MAETYEIYKAFQHDESEAVRLTYNHEIMKDALNGELIPVSFEHSSPLTILDSATADGVWLRDCASTLSTPSSGNHKFVGTDINAADFPETPSAMFEYHVQDVKKPWPQEWKSHFDLVHQRLALSAAGPKGKEVVSSLAELVKPGGWIVLEDPTASVKHEAGPAWAKVFTVMQDLMAVMGSRAGVIDEVPEWLKGIGFTNVQEKVFMTKYGALNENEDLAKKGLAHARTTLMGFQTAAKNIGLDKVRLSQKEVESLVEEGVAEAEERGHGFYMRMVWAQRKE